MKEKERSLGGNRGLVVIKEEETRWEKRRKEPGGWSGGRERDIDDEGGNIMRKGAHLGNEGNMKEVTKWEEGRKWKREDEIIRSDRGTERGEKAKDEKEWMKGTEREKRWRPWKGMEWREERMKQDGETKTSEGKEKVTELGRSSKLLGVSCWLKE